MISLNEEDFFGHNPPNKTKEKILSIESVNDTKDKIKVDRNLQIESERKAFELANMNDESEESKEEKDFSSHDSLVYHIENNLTSDFDDTAVETEANQNITRKRKAKPDLWKTNVVKRLRNAGKECLG